MCMIKQTLDDRFERMPWDRIDTVVFDVGNVLITPGFRDAFRVYPSAEHPFTAEEQAFLLSRMFQSPYWTMMDRGVLPLDTAVEAMTGRYTELKPHVDYLARNWMEFKTELPEGVRALRCCKEHGKQLLVLSNYPDYAFTRLCERFDFFALFDGMVVSSREGRIKPERELFAIAEERYSLIPERTVLIDDAALNCEAAMHCLWQAVCFNEPGKLDRFVR